LERVRDELRIDTFLDVFMYLGRARFETDPCLATARTIKKCSISVFPRIREEIRSPFYLRAACNHLTCHCLRSTGARVEFGVRPLYEVQVPSVRDLHHFSNGICRGPFSQFDTVDRIRKPVCAKNAAPFASTV